MSDRALVRNATDKAALQRAERRERRRESRFTDALREVMSAPAGRIVVCELLKRARVYESIWDPSSRIHYNAGRQDFGHELLAMIVDVDEALYFEMEREGRAYQKAEDRETDAAHTPRAEQQGEDR